MSVREILLLLLWMMATSVGQSKWNKISDLLSPLSHFMKLIMIAIWSVFHAYYQLIFK